MREITIKPAGKYAIIIPFCFLLLMTFLYFVGCFDGSFDWDNITDTYWISVSIATFVMADYVGQRYTLNKDGFHQRWFLHTGHYTWDSFTEVSIEPVGEKDGEVIRIICFNRNISYINRQANLMLHPFRFFVFNLANSEKKDGNFKEDEILELLKENGVHVVYYYSRRE